MKKFLVLALCAVVIFTLVCCKAQKVENGNEVNNPIEQPVQDVDEKVETKTEKTKIEINVKPLEETDKNALSEAAKSLGFENEGFFHAVANAMDKKPEEMTQADIDKVHYIAVGPETKDSYSVFIGYIDYMDLCFSEEANSSDIMEKLNELVMISEFEYNIETDTLSDLGNFKNIEMFEIYDVHIHDVSFIKNYSILALGYFKNNGIKDVASLVGYNPETLIELDFTGNDISDWKPLYPIKEKITVYHDIANGFLLTLEGLIEQQNNPVDIPEPDTTDKTDDEVFVVDEHGNPADFSSLFD